MKKLLTLLLTLLMVFILVGCNSKEDAPVVQEPEKQEEVEETKEEPEIVGGYVNAEDGTLTDELKDIFSKALEGLLGAKYEPVELVATQVVAGTNYKFLANGTKTTNPITKGTYYITIYKDLQGNVSLLDIETIEEKQEETSQTKKDILKTYNYWVVFYDQYDNELQREALKYGTVPEYKSWLPEGFDYWVYKKTDEVVNEFKPIITNTYFKAVCHEVEPVYKPEDKTVKYLDWDEDETKLIVKTVENYELVNNSTTTLSSGFYVVKGNVTTGALFVEGTETAPTYLILCNGAELTATSTNDDDESGINVYKDNSLIISTATNANATLNATGGDNSAGIGGGDNNCGYITINGGNINATGGLSGGAGIGGGECGDDNQTITINGGNVKAKSLGYAAGIGGGGSVSNTNSKIVINGGTIEATGGDKGSGIGGGHKGDGGTITINGGTITAIAGTNAAGIGGGKRDDNKGGNGATVTIKGGTITATAGGEASGIGGSEGGTPGTIEFVGTFAITAGDDVLSATIIDQNTFKANDGHNKIYVHIEQSACLARGTLITMADGTRRLIETLSEGDLIRVFNHDTGKVSSAKIMDYWQYEEKKSGLITLHFTNDIDVNIVTAHGFYNKEENKYVVLDANNINSYIGKHFYNVDNNSWETLLSATYSNEKVDTFFIATEGQFDTVAEGMLNVEDGVYYVLRNTFDFDNNMKIDEMKKANDIECYGLFDSTDFEYLTKEAFEKYGAANLKVALGKGIITEEFLDILKAESITYESENIVEEYIPENVQHSVR